MSRLTHSRAIELANELADYAGQHVAEADLARRMPAGTLHLLRKLTLHRLMTPERFGGSELGWPTFVEVVLTVSRACASTGWCLGFLAYHSQLLAQFEERAQQAVWDADPDALLAQCLAPFGKVRRADGGFLLSGQWSWCSGVDHCSWIMLGAVADTDGATPDGPHLRLFLLPRSDFEVLDTWKVSGLRASGSNDVKVGAAFVPLHRTIAADDLRDGTTPGALIYADNPVYRLPQVAAAPLALATPAVGSALGARDAVLKMAKERLSSPSFAPEYPSFRPRLALAHTEVEMAAQMLRAIAASAQSQAAHSLAERAKIRYDYAHAVRLAAHATDVFFELSGARANYDDSLVQRHWRDVHAIAAHRQLNEERAADLLGRRLLGLEPNPKDGVW